MLIHTLSRGESGNNRQTLLYLRAAQLLARLGHVNLGGTIARHCLERMISDAGLTFYAVVRALFDCGSITKKQKRRWGRVYGTLSTATHCGRCRAKSVMRAIADCYEVLREMEDKR